MTPLHVLFAGLLAAAGLGPVDPTPTAPPPPTVIVVATVAAVASPSPVASSSPTAPAADFRWTAPTERAITSVLRAVPTVTPTSVPTRTVAPTATATPSAGLGPRVPPAIRRWSPLIQEAAAEHDLDPLLLAALMQTESGGDPNAVSPANAIGLMQIVDGPADPAANVDAGARMLAENLERFGRLDVALAAYNAGPGNVLEHGGIPDWPETRAHISRTLAAYDAFRAA